MTTPPPPSGPLPKGSPGLDVLLYDGGGHVEADTLGHAVHPSHLVTSFNLMHYTDKLERKYAATFFNQLDCVYN